MTSATPYRLSASLTGWKNVVPPDVQFPEPPEVKPCAWTRVAPLGDTYAPPESPGSAQTLVRVRPETMSPPP